MATRTMAAIVLLCVTLRSIAVGADVFDAIDERQKLYDKTVQEGREFILGAFTREILKANEQGRSEDAARLTDHLKHFRSAGIMMTPELYDDFIAFGTDTHKARELLLRAYEDAEKECVTRLRLEKAEEFRAAIKAQGLNSKLVSIRLAKRKTDFIHHAGYLGFVRPIKERALRMNATFEMVAGLSDSEATSFRSVNVPDHYLVHGDSRIRIQSFKDEEAFRRNATFRFARGQGNKSALMLIPVNFPTHCIHARESELWISPIQQNQTFSERAEFELADPQFPFWPKSSPME